MGQESKKKAGNPSVLTQGEEHRGQQFCTACGGNRWYQPVEPGVREPLAVLGFYLRALSLNCVTVSRGRNCHHVPKND